MFLIHSVFGMFRQHHNIQKQNIFITIYLNIMPLNQNLQNIQYINT